MGFMIPYAAHFSREELIDTAHIECQQCGEVADRYNIAAAACLDCCPPEPGWYGYLSAPGYLDRTEYRGPFASEADALREIMEAYDVDEHGD